MRVVGKETDLRFLDRRAARWIVGDGKFNMPDGEIHTAPITSTIHGQIYFEFPGVLGGRLMHDIRLRWEQGHLVEATASTNQDYLQSIVRTDAGASLIGEFAFGTNPHVTRFYKDILIDEKIGGTVHIALGRAYPESGGDNQSAIHWDIIKDIRRRAQSMSMAGSCWKEGSLPSMSDGHVVPAICWRSISAPTPPRACWWREDGDGVVASHVVPHGIEMPQPGWVEQDADAVWWRDCVAICRQLLAQSGVDSRRDCRVGISSTRPACCRSTATGRPLRPGILYGIDTRARPKIAELEACVRGARCSSNRYGTKLSSQSTSPKIAGCASMSRRFGQDRICC